MKIRVTDAASDACDAECHADSDIHLSFLSPMHAFTRLHGGSKHTIQPFLSPARCGNERPIFLLGARLRCTRFVDPLTPSAPSQLMAT